MGIVSDAVPPATQLLRTSGFTLIELLLVITIAGITLGLAALQFRPDSHSLEAEAQRLASLMQLASDEAILRNRPILLEADSRQYQFFIRNKGSWTLLVGDDLLRARKFTGPALRLRIAPESGTASIRILFEPQPLGKSFVLTMSSDEATVGIQSDGSGRYVVQ
jgi:general secretion pathway protein H